MEALDAIEKRIDILSALVGQQTNNGTFTTLFLLTLELLCENNKFFFYYFFNVRLSNN